MTDVISSWRIDESVRETSITDNVREFPEYIEDQSTPAKKTYAGYVSPNEATIITVSELNHPGVPNDRGLFIYLYEVADGMNQAPFWLFSGGDNVESAREMARQLVAARDETSYEPSDIGLIPDLRERVPELSVHTEFTSDSYPTEYVEENGIEFDLPDPTGHPLEDYLPGYVAGTQFQKYWTCFDCEVPDCSSEIEGGNQSSWELNSTLYLGESNRGVFVPVGWRCGEHSTNTLQSFMTDIPDPDVVSDWESRIDEEQTLVNKRAQKLEQAGAFAENEGNSDDSNLNIDIRKSRQARQELEQEGVLEVYTQAEKEERAKVTSLSMGPDIERYYLVRCDIDCMCFGGYYQNVSYIRNPIVVDESEYS